MTDPSLRSPPFTLGGMSIRFAFQSTLSEMLYRQPRVDLNMLARDARVLRQRDKRIRAILQVSLEHKGVSLPSTHM